jgi:hypothetical protein
MDNFFYKSFVTHLLTVENLTGHQPEGTQDFQPAKAADPSGLVHWLVG